MSKKQKKISYYFDFSEVLNYFFRKKDPNSKANFSLKKVTDNLIAANKLQKVVEARLREKHNRKRLSKKQKEVAESITSIIVSNEPPEYWTSKAQDYIDDPSDKNESRVNEVSELAVEHQVNDYLASILYASKK